MKVQGTRAAAIELRQPAPKTAPARLRLGTRAQAIEVRTPHAAPSDAAKGVRRLGTRAAAIEVRAGHTAPKAKAKRRRGHVHANGSGRAPRVPDRAKQGVQAAGGAARGVAKAGSPAARAVVGKAPFKFGRVPGAPLVTSAFALHDTIREFQRSGLSHRTGRTAAGGVGGVAGAFKGAALGATIGAFGGPVGAIAGGAIGGVVGGIAGSAVGAGIADGVKAARDVIRRTKIDSVDDVFTTGGRAAWAGVNTLGRSAASGVVSSVRDLGGSIGNVADKAEKALDKITPW